MSKLGFSKVNIFDSGKFSQNFTERVNVFLENPSSFLSKKSLTDCLAILNEKQCGNFLNRTSDGRLKIDVETSEVVSYLACVDLLPDSEVSYKPNSTRFPDIIIDSWFGVEVKSSKSSKETLGNSSVQRGIGLKEIYTAIFTEHEFVKMVPYEEIISGIKVDHNPRFGLRLDGESAFNFRKTFNCTFVEYLNKSVEEKHGMVRSYLLNSSSVQDWMWYHGRDDDFAVSTIGKNLLIAWRNLDKGHFRIEVLSLKPRWVIEGNHEKLREWTLKKYGAIGAVKDVFSGGGKKAAKNQKDIKLPKVFYWMDYCLEEIYKYLHDKNLNGDAWANEALSLVVEQTETGRNRLESKEALYLRERIGKVFT